MMRTSGNWLGTKSPCYFLAANPQSLVFAAPVHPYLLTPLNDLTGDSAHRDLEIILGHGAKMLLDSGAYATIERHAEARGLPVTLARTEDPHTMEGFVELREKYVDMMQRYGERLWGYIELDFGDTDSKRRLRREVESEGLRPIPVYHPITDPWEYFDELCEGYDRVCVSNMTSEGRATRLRLLATISERKQAYPGVWIHLLGFTPNEWALAYDFESCDSSTWLAGVRWPGAHRARAALRAFSSLQSGMIYDLGSSDTDEQGHGIAKRAYAYDAAMNQRNWHRARRSHAG